MPGNSWHWPSPNGRFIQLAASGAANPTHCFFYIIWVVHPAIHPSIHPYPLSIHGRRNAPWPTQAWPTLRPSAKLHPKCSSPLMAKCHLRALWYALITALHRNVSLLGSRGASGLPHSTKKPGWVWKLRKLVWRFSMVFHIYLSLTQGRASIC